MSAEPLLTADEVAAMLRVTKSWVYAETRANRMPHVALGRYVRYRESALVAWLADLEHDSSGRALLAPYPGKRPSRARRDSGRSRTSAASAL